MEAHDHGYCPACDERREENARLRAEKERLHNVENEAAYSRAAIEELRKRSEWLDVWFQNAFPDWQTAIPPEGIPLRHFLLDRLVHERFEAREENARLRSIIKGVHGALTDAGSVIVPGSLDADLAPAIRQLTRERDEAREALREWREAESAPDCVACCTLDAALVSEVKP